MFLGILLVSVGFYLMRKNVSSTYTGLLFGLGSGLFGVSVANIFAYFQRKKKPELWKKVEVEKNDERNKLLHCKTGATLHRINIYINCLLMLIFSVFGLPLWAVLSLVGVQLLNGILYILIFNKNNKVS